MEAIIFWIVLLYLLSVVIDYISAGGETGDYTLCKVNVCVQTSEDIDENQRFSDRVLKTKPKRNCSSFATIH